MSKLKQRKTQEWGLKAKIFLAEFIHSINEEAKKDPRMGIERRKKDSQYRITRCLEAKKDPRMGIERYSDVMFVPSRVRYRKQRKTQEWGLKDYICVLVVPHDPERKQRKTQEWGLKGGLEYSDLVYMVQEAKKDPRMGIESL